MNRTKIDYPNEDLYRRHPGEGRDDGHGRFPWRPKQLPKNYLFTLIFLILTSTLGAASDSIRFQGRLTDNEGQPIVGNPLVKFRIFGTLEGGNPLWESRGTEVDLFQKVDTNSAGLFSTELTGFETTFFSQDRDYFLEVVIWSHGAQPLKPRQKLSRVPMAFQARFSDEAQIALTIQDNSISSEKIQPDAVQGVHIAADSITSEHIKNNEITQLDLGPDSVRSRHIKDASITNLDLSTSAVRGENILDGSISGVELASASITSQIIENNTITKLDLAVGAVDSAIIKDLSIETDDLKEKSISPDKIASGYALIPEGAIMMFTKTCPQGWSRFDELDNRFPRGAETFNEAEAAGGTAKVSGLSLSNEGEHQHQVDSHIHDKGDIMPMIGLRNIGDPTFDNNLVMKLGDVVGSFSAETAGQWYSHSFIRSNIYRTPADVGTNSRDVLVWAPLMVGNTGSTSPQTNTQPNHTHTVTSDGEYRPPYLDIIFCQKDEEKDEN